MVSVWLEAWWDTRHCPWLNCLNLDGDDDDVVVLAAAAVAAAAAAVVVVVDVLVVVVVVVFNVFFSLNELDHIHKAL